MAEGFIKERTNGNRTSTRSPKKRLTLQILQISSNCCYRGPERRTELINRNGTRLLKLAKYVFMTSD